MNEANTEGQITVERRGHLLLMGIDRQAKLNGLTPQMFTDLSQAYTQLDEDPELRAGVLFAHGKHFTAGLDLPKFVEAMQSGNREYLFSGVDVYGLKRKCRKPIVCAVQGYTFTAGIEMMLACDIVVAASDAIFTQMEPKRGIMATGGATIRFVQRCGWGNAMYHLLTADRFDAQEAQRIGLVQEIVLPGEQADRAIALAERIAGLAPLAVQATKGSGFTYLEQGEGAAIAEFIDIQQRLSSSEDAKEGVQSFVERREPNFTGQ